MSIHQLILKYEKQINELSEERKTYVEQGKINERKQVSLEISYITLFLKDLRSL